MKHMARWLVLGLVLCGATLLAQDIISFQNGYLTFENTDTNLYYRIEFRPNLTGIEEWRADLPVNIKSADAEVTVPVGVFYRVAASVSPFVIEGACVPKTGQTTSYRTGDDGTYQKGVAWPDPRFTVTTHDTDEVVTDNMTGLMWVKAPHSLTGNSSTKNWNNAIDFCNDLDFAGHSDWRLPNSKELFSLIDKERFLHALPSGHPFEGIPDSAWYWSSSTVAATTNYAWTVGSCYGYVQIGDKTWDFRVWPVRAGQ